MLLRKPYSWVDAALEELVCDSYDESCGLTLSVGPGAVDCTVLRHPSQPVGRSGGEGAHKAARCGGDKEHSAEASREGGQQGDQAGQCRGKP